MMKADACQRFTGILSTLPTSARLMITAFLAIIGSGYLLAVANVFYSHQMADGKPGVTLDDIRAVYAGMDVSAAAEEVPSRMLTMIRGEMRQYFSSDANFSVLEEWLKSGGKEASLTEGKTRVNPQRVLLIDCMRCHAQGTGTQISNEAPFGPDEFNVDYAMISRFVTASESKAKGMLRAAPQYSISRLVLVSHQHMLAIPVFTLLVGLMFMTTRLPGGVRAVLMPLPMLALVLDFSGWWLARIADASVYVIAAAGGLFGLTFGAQILCILVELWRTPSQPRLYESAGDRSH